MIGDSDRLKAEGFGTEIGIRCVGIYALLYKGRLVYCRRSTNVWTALAKIFKTKKRKGGMGRTELGFNWTDVKEFEFDELLIKYCYLNELEDLERDLIEKYQPEFNRNTRQLAKRPTGVKLEYAELVELLGEKGHPFERRI